LDSRTDAARRRKFCRIFREDFGPLRRSGPRPRANLLLRLCAQDRAAVRRAASLLAHAGHGHVLAGAFDALGDFAGGADDCRLLAECHDTALAVAVADALHAFAAAVVAIAGSAVGEMRTHVLGARVGRAAHAVVAVRVHVVPASDAAEGGVAFAAHTRAVHGRVDAALGGAGICRALDVVAALAGVAARRAATGTAFGAVLTAVETAGPIFTTRVGLAFVGLADAVGVALAIGRFGAAAARRWIAKIAGRTLAIRRMAALPAAARILGAAQLVVAVCGAAAGAAGCRFTVGARAALGAASAQRLDAAFASFAGSDRARVVVFVALRVVAAFGGAARSLTLAAERARAVRVRTQVVLARVGGARAAVVALLGYVFSRQDAARLARATALRRAIL